MSQINMLKISMSNMIAEIAIIWSHFRNISWFSIEYSAIKYQNLFVLISIILNFMYKCWLLKIAIWFFFSMTFNNVCRQELSVFFLRKTAILIKSERIFCKRREMTENVFDFFNNFISWSNDFLRKSVMIHFLRFLKRFRNIQSMLFFFCFEFKYWSKTFDVKTNVCFDVFVVVVVKCLKI